MHVLCKGSRLSSGLKYIMVRYNPSVRSYVDDDDPSETHDYTEKVDRMVDCTQRIIKAVHHVLPLAPISQTIMLPYFTRYFGPHTASKERKVRAVVRKWFKFVQHPEGVDVNIHVGEKHLAESASVFVQELNPRVCGNLDLTKLQQAFDEYGRYSPASQALYYSDAIRKPDGWQAYTSGPLAQSHVQPGLTEIFFNPAAMKQEHGLSPIQGSQIIEELANIRDLLKLPAILLHELCHSSLLGGRYERMEDQGVELNDARGRIRSSPIRPCFCIFAHFIWLP